MDYSTKDILDGVRKATVEVARAHADFAVKQANMRPGDSMAGGDYGPSVKPKRT